MPLAPLLVASLFWYGWASQVHMNRIIPNIGSILMGIGLDIMLMATLACLIDTFTAYADSALAANTVLGSISGAFLRLAGKIYASLKFGWGFPPGFLVLAFTSALGFSFP